MQTHFNQLKLIASCNFMSVNETENQIFNIQTKWSKKTEQIRRKTKRKQIDLFIHLLCVRFCVAIFFSQTPISFGIWLLR